MEKDLYKVMIKNIIDYEGKLNNHSDYIKMLKILENTCSFIGIASEHEITDKFKNDIIKTEESTNWWGVKTSFTTTLYYIKNSKELFDFLRKYETFCKTVSHKNNFSKTEYIKVERTNFGYNDIAFFDKNYNILLRTNTHEGFIFVSDNIDELFRK